MLDERAENAKKSAMLMSLLQLPYNRTCADCGFIIGEGLVKANAALGVFICLYCSECHTAVLPLSICAVKSVDGYSMNMRLARWSYNEIRFMARWGNKRANAYWAATLPPNPLWGSHRFTSKIHRENHIKAKYRLKTWVVPNSVPSLTNFTDVELRILNDRGPGFRSPFRPRGSIRSFVDPGDASVIAVSRAILSSPSPNKPSVKLPPINPDLEGPVDADNREMACSPSLASDHFPLSVIHGSKDFPGRRWTEQWKERSVVQSHSAAESISSSEEKSRESDDQIQEKSTRKADLSSTFLSHSRAHPQYRVSIPSPSSQQIHNFHENSDFCSQEEVKSPIHYIYQATSSFSQSPCSELCPADNGGLKTRTKPVVQIVWEEAILPNFSSSQTTQPPSPIFGSQNLMDTPPTFPFTQSTATETFQFQPILPQTLQSSPLEHSNSFLLDRTLPSHGNMKFVEPSSSEMYTELQTASQGRTTVHTACYGWNFYRDCEGTGDGICQKMHVCELCSSSEHRAAQHWHHLATAPLPEIQERPKLSTLAPPPDSPTLSALKDHVSLFIPDPLQVESQTASADQSLPLFVPIKLGLEGSQNLTAQSERQRFRRRLAKSRSFNNDTQAQYAEIPTEVSKPRKNRHIPIVVQPSSPFEKPVEVILPPPVKPFQRKSSTEETTSKEASTVSEKASKSALRVTAPVFEPSHVGAWIPIAGNSNQFSGLFKIPSRESRRIEIVSPDDRKQKKGKEVSIEYDSPQPSSTPERASEEGSNEKTSTARTEDMKTSTKKHLSSYGEQWPSSCTFLRGPSTKAIDSSLSSTAVDWCVSEIFQCSQSAIDKTIPLRASRTGLPTEKLEQSGLEILDEQLDAMMGQGSEETISATLETIIEICSTSSTMTTPRSTEFEQFRGRSQANIPLSITIPVSSWPSYGQGPPSQLVSLQTNQSFTLANFAEDDIVFSPFVSSSFGHASDAYEIDNRPRSADSVSTAPLTLFGSPSTKVIDLNYSPPDLVDQTPLKSRIERMMSCAVARGSGQCNCGLGDWFHPGHAS